MESEIVFGCSDRGCDAGICPDCFDPMLDHFLGEEQVPGCIGADCRGDYIVSDLAGLDGLVMEKYEQVLVTALLKDKGGEVDILRSREVILERLRAERLEFLRNRFPAAIVITAEVAYKGRFRKMIKRQAAKVAKGVTVGKRCMNLICRGFLNKDFFCPSCGSQFCKQCEREMAEGHQCKKEDIDSLEAIRAMVHCPGCNLPVFKNEGCDHIKCAHCGAKFMYTTGQAGGHGSHNTAVSFKSEEVTRLSSFIDLPAEMAGILREMERYAPKESDDTILIKLLGKFMDGKHGVARKIAREYDGAVRLHRFSRFYHSLMVQIDKMHRAGELSLGAMEELLARLMEEVGALRATVRLPRKKKATKG